MSLSWACFAVIGAPVALALKAVTLTKCPLVEGNALVQPLPVEGVHFISVLRDIAIAVTACTTKSHGSGDK